MKKALIFMLVALVLSFGIYANGSDEENGGKKITLNVLGYGDNSNQEGIIWNKQIAEFKEMHPEVNIVSELLYDEAYHQKVTARLAAGDAPHVAYMGADARWGAPWKEAGMQVDNRPYIDPEVFDYSLIPEMGSNGERYYIPIGTGNITTVLYANVPLLESLGLDVPKTYEDMVAMVPVAKKAGLEVVSIAGADSWVWGSCFLSSLIARTSGDPKWVSKAVNGENKFNDPAMVDALALVKRMVDDGVISEKAVLVDYGAALSNFSNQKSLFMIDGQWRAGGVENPDVRNNMKLMALPVMPGEKSSTAGSVAAAWSVGYGLTKKAIDDGVDKIAGDFIAYINNEKWSTQRLRDGAIVAPVLKNYQVPSDLPPEAAQKVALAQSAMTTEVIDAFLTGPPNDTLNEGMQKIASGSATPKEVADAVESLAR